VIHNETGSGYLLRFRTGQALRIADGEIGGPLNMMSDEADLAGGASVVEQDPPAPLLAADPAGPPTLSGGGDAGEAALRQELSAAFQGLGATATAADQFALTSALELIEQLPPGPERDLVLGSHEIVGQALESPAGHVEVAMRLIAEARSEGLTLQQLLDRQRAAWGQIEPFFQRGEWQGIGVGAADPRAVYSRAMIRMDEQAGRQIEIVPRDQRFGDRDFFEHVAAQHPTLYDMGIDLKHGWHGHALQDFVATSALQRAGAQIDSAAFRQVLGAIQQIGQVNALPYARRAIVGQLIWQAYYDSTTRPEFITAVLRKVLGYID